MKIKTFRNTVKIKLFIKNLLYGFLCASLMLTSYTFIVFDSPDVSVGNTFLNAVFTPPPKDINTFLETVFSIEKELTSEETAEPPTYIDYGKKLDEILSLYPQEKPELVIPEGCFGICAENISKQGNEKKILFSDKSNKKLTAQYIESLTKKDYPIKASQSSDEPLVLILHTHTTEAYLGENDYYYNPKNAVAETRSHKNSENVIAVGEVFASVLESMGINTLHCKDYHDIYVFNQSYNHSYDTVEKYLKAYPSIKYVIDLHRDSVIHTNGTKVQPVYEINGKRAAQVMLVIGTDGGGLTHKNWEKNLTLATMLQEKLVESYGDLARPLNIRSGRFNQQLCPGMLLLEVGSCGNTLEQAKYAARLVALEYAGLIKDNL